MIQAPTSVSFVSSPLLGPPFSARTLQGVKKKKVRSGKPFKTSSSAIMVENDVLPYRIKLVHEEGGLKTSFHYINIITQLEFSCHSP